METSIQKLPQLLRKRILEEKRTRYKRKDGGDIGGTRERNSLSTELIDKNDNEFRFNLPKGSRLFKSTSKLEHPLP